MTKRTPVPAPKPTVPAFARAEAHPPRVIVPDFAPSPEELGAVSTPAEIETLLTSAGFPAPVASSLHDALRELLDSCPVDISTCTGVSPKSLERYLAARTVAVRVLTEK